MRQVYTSRDKKERDHYLDARELVLDIGAALGVDEVSPEQFASALEVAERLLKKAAARRKR